MKLQQGAWTAFRNRAFPLALELTRKAREQASLAISNSRLSEQLEGVVLSRLERAREMLERAREVLPVPMGPTVTNILEQARNNLAQGWEFYRQRRFRAAVKLVEQVEQAARRLMSIAQSGQRDAEIFRRRLENVERLMEYARELLAECGSDIGREHLNRAEEAFSRAREFQARNQPRAALMALSRAKEETRRAARQCQDGERLERRYLALQNELELALDRLSESNLPGLDAVRKLLEQAGEQLALARNYLAESKVESAQLSLQAAQIALRQAERYLNGRR
jgi:hypothetical protein